MLYFFQLGKSIMRKSFSYSLIALALIGLLLAGGGWAGFRLASDLDNQLSIAYRVHVRLESYYNSLFRTETPTWRNISTSHLTLRERSVSLPVKAEYFGGGITDFQGRSVLVLDRLGHFFHVENERTRELSIEPPDNRVAELRRQEKAGRFSPASINYKWFRYNDVLHMDNAGKQWLLVSYTEWQPDDFCFNSAMAQLDLPTGALPENWKATADDWHIVARTEPCLAPLEFGTAIKGIEAGGRMAVSDESTVIWSSGSYERDDAYPEVTPLAQDDENDYGKILEVSLETGEIRHIAKGLRNPQGLTIDVDGTIWVTDHGMRGGDELNRVFEGANFGYPIVSYGTRYTREPAGASGIHSGHNGFDKPIVAFVPGIAPSSAITIKDFHYAWDNDIIVGAFRGDLYRVRVEDDRTIFAERIEIGVRPRDMVMLEDGSFAVWTDFRQLIFYSVEDAPDPTQIVLGRIEGITSDRLRSNVASVFEGCLSCHSMNEGEHGSGPSLANLCGRSLGSTDFQDYSDALQGLGGGWTTEQIANFINDPQSFSPGTTMSWGPLEDSEAAIALATALCPPDK